MKRWIRPALLLLGFLLTASFLGAVPAEAAKPVPRTPTTITYQGYTLTWSTLDASDLRVVRTAGRPDRFPGEVSSRTIRQAKSRVASSATQQASVDSCTGVPDSFGQANFQPACADHDLCYSPTSTTDRRQCDRVLLAELTQACSIAYPGTLATSMRLSCYTVAGIYYVGVRLLGERFYRGTGDRS